MLLLMAPFYYEDPGAANVAQDYEYGDPVALTTGTNPDVTSNDPPIPDTSPAVFWGFTNPAASAFFVEPAPFNFSVHTGQQRGSKMQTTFTTEEDVRFPVTIKDGTGTPVDIQGGVTSLSVKSLYVIRGDEPAINLDLAAGIAFSEISADSGDDGQYIATLDRTALLLRDGVTPFVQQAGDDFVFVSQGEVVPGTTLVAGKTYADIVAVSGAGFSIC